jgi:quinol monooxygenase YgiN
MISAAPHVSWNVELSIRPGQMEAFRTLTAEMVEVARGEEGVLVYERFVSPDGQSAHVYERWCDSRTALAHLTLFGGRFGARYSALVERKRFTVCGDLSDDLKRLLVRFGATQFLTPLAGFSKWRAEGPGGA